MMLTLRYAFRQLLKSPTFTTVSILMLALGIGMSTSAFSVTNFLLLRSMPYPAGEQLVRIHRSASEGPSLPHSPANYLDIKASATSFSHVAAYFANPTNVADVGQAPQQEMVINATADFFTLLGVQPFLGRGFSPDEDQPGKGTSVVLANSYWKKHYSGDPNVIGKSIRVGTDVRTIVGVLPEVFEDTQVWFNASMFMPITIWPNSHTERGGKWFQIVARLNPDVSKEAAQSELAVIAARLDHDYPKENANDKLRISGLYASNIDNTTRQMVWFVTALAVAVLGIACANLAGVQVARAFARSHEYAVRASLGATRAQLVAPLLTESLMLSLIGGLAGLLVAYYENQFVTHFRAADRAAATIPLDGHVLLFSVLMALVTGLTFGIAPAWLVSRRSMHDTLKQTSGGSTPPTSQRRMKSVLIVGQLALALVLVSAAASFGLAAKKALQSDYGWSPQHLFSAMIGLPYAPFPDDKSKIVLEEALHERMARLPGVERFH